jgi:hypothetical protein
MGIYNAMLYPQSAPAPKPVSKARVVNDAPVADVDAVVVVEGARGDEVAGEWRLLVGAQKRIARSACKWRLDAACSVCPCEHGGRSYAASRSIAMVRWY